MRAAVAVVLVAAVVMAAGCVSPGLNNQTHALPEGKYVLLTHDTDFKVVSESGICFNTTGGVFSFSVIFNEKNDVLTLLSPPFHKDQINESLVLIFVIGSRRIHEEGNNDTGNWEYGIGKGVYSLPSILSSNVTLDSVSEDGTIALRFNNRSIVLKPDEQWKNTTSRFETEDWKDFITKPEKKSNNSTGEDSDWRCYKEILITESIRNAGIFNKKDIVVIERE